MSEDTPSTSSAGPRIEYVQYKDERDMPTLQRLIDAELSEPYSVFTYRYFLTPWPNLCYFSYVDGKPAGVVVCKIDDHRGKRRGYLGMLVVQPQYRKLGLGSALVQKVIQEMIQEGIDEVSLEAETTNHAALRLYEKLGFIRDKRLQRYYLSGQDAFRLKLRLRSPAPPPSITYDETYGAK